MPQGVTQIPGSGQQESMHVEPEGQESPGPHAGNAKQEPPLWRFTHVQAPDPPETGKQPQVSSGLGDPQGRRLEQAGSHVWPGSHAAPPYWANAGVRSELRIGADQATAAPAPMRLSIRRREILL